MSVPQEFVDAILERLGPAAARRLAADPSDLAAIIQEEAKATIAGENQAIVEEVLDRVRSGQLPTPYDLRILRLKLIASGAASLLDALEGSYDVFHEWHDDIPQTIGGILRQAERDDFEAPFPRPTQAQTPGIVKRYLARAESQDKKAAAALERSRAPANTERRQRQRAGSYAQAERHAGMAYVWRRLADQAAAGAVPPMLRGLRTDAELAAILDNRQSPRVPADWAASAARAASDQYDPSWPADGYVRLHPFTAHFLKAQAKRCKASDAQAECDAILRRVAVWERLRKARVAGPVRFARARKLLLAWMEEGAAELGGAPVAEVRPGQIAGYFPTPPQIAARVAAAAELRPGRGHELDVLEPSAGSGNLIQAVLAASPGLDITAIEPDERLRAELLRKTEIAPAFRTLEELPADRLFDRVVMNPPFERNLWAAHVLRGWKALRPGGVLVAIVPSWSAQQNKGGDVAAVRALVDEAGEPPVDLGAPFEGTGVRASMLRLRKPRLIGQDTQASEPFDEGPAGKAEAEPAEFGPVATEDDLPWESVVAAFRWNTMDAEGHAERYRRDFAADLNAFYRSLVKGHPEREPEVRAAVLEHKKRLRPKVLAYLEARSRTASPHVTGPSKFPTARNQKRLGVEDKRRRELAEFTRRARSKIRNKLFPTQISSDDPGAINALRAKKADLEAQLELMKQANKVVRSKMNRTLKLDTLARLTGGSAEHLLKPDYAGRTGFPAYKTRNMRSELKRIERRIAALEELADREPTTQRFGDIEVVEDAEANRVRLFFPEKPSADARARLKSRGFRWAPSVGAWQRKRTQAGIEAAERTARELSRLENPEAIRLDESAALREAEVARTAGARALVRREIGDPFPFPVYSLRIELVDELPDAAVFERKRDGARTYLHRSTRQPGFWQASRTDAAGDPLGHRDYPSLDAGLEGELRESELVELVRLENPSDVLIVPAGRGRFDLVVEGEPLNARPLVRRDAELLAAAHDTTRLLTAAELVELRRLVEREREYERRRALRRPGLAAPQQGRLLNPSGLVSRALARLPRTTAARLAKRPELDAIARAEEGRTGAVVGAATDVLYSDPDSGALSSLAAYYALVPAARVIPSHDPRTFTPSPGYPAELQERPYERDELEQAKVIRQADQFAPALLWNTNPDAVNGPPIITPQGFVLGGNSRAMSALRVMQDRPEEFRTAVAEALERHGEAFGLEGASSGGLMLVRVIDDGESYDPVSISRTLNRSMTQTLSLAAASVSLGRLLPPEFFRSLGEWIAQEDATLNAVLQRHSKWVLRELQRAGVLTAQDYSRFAKMKHGRVTSELSIEGRATIRLAVLGALVNDRDVLAMTSPRMETLLEGIAPLAMAIHVDKETAGTDFDLVPAIREAVAAVSLSGATSGLQFSQLFQTQGLAFDTAEGATAEDRYPGLSQPLVAYVAMWLAEAQTRPRKAFDAFRSYFRGVPGAGKLLFDDTTPDELRRATLPGGADFPSAAAPLEEIAATGAIAWLAGAPVRRANPHPIVTVAQLISALAGVFG